MLAASSCQLKKIKNAKQTTQEIFAVVSQKMIQHFLGKDVF